MKNKETKFVKVGENIMFKQITEGLDYNLEAGVTYEPKYDRYSGEISLKLANKFEMPKKVYTTETDNKFMHKVLKQYSFTDTGVLGIMLSGLKGSGKSITAKRIANNSNLPIIIMDKTFPAYQIKQLFSKLAEIDACIVFDEFDKIGEDYDDDLLLQVLDGLNTSGKKLVLFTCNNEECINEYLKDRCSRIRYWRRFEEMNASMITEVVKDNLNNKNKVDSLVDFIQKNLKCISFDNILSFIHEANCYPNDEFEDLLNDMNLSRK